jgi:hypothetical protein
MSSSMAPTADWTLYVRRVWKARAGAEKRANLLRTIVCRGMFWRSAGQAKWGGKSRMSEKVTQQASTNASEQRKAPGPKVAREGPWPVRPNIHATGLRKSCLICMDSGVVCLPSTVQLCSGLQEDSRMKGGRCYQLEYLPWLPESQQVSLPVTLGDHSQNHVKGDPCVQIADT